MIKQHTSHNYSLPDVNESNDVFTFPLCLALSGKMYFNTCTSLGWKENRKYILRESKALIICWSGKDETTLQIKNYK